MENGDFLPDRINEMTSEQYNDWQDHFQKLFEADPELYSPSFKAQYLDQPFDQYGESVSPKDLTEMDEPLRGRILRSVSSLDLEGFDFSDGDSSGTSDKEAFPIENYEESTERETKNYQKEILRCSSNAKFSL